MRMVPVTRILGCTSININYDTSSNDGSYLIGIGGNPFNPHQSEISVTHVNDWEGIEG